MTAFSSTDADKIVVMAVSHAGGLDAAVAALIGGYNPDPFALLGPHRDDDGVVVRAFQPAARQIEVRLRPGGETIAMEKRHPAGVWAARLGSRAGDGLPDYRLRITYPGNHAIEIDDAYRYGRVLTDFDLHLFAEGTHRRAFEKFGSHRIAFGSTTGVHFAVWAPNADRVSVIGDFNAWDGRIHPMRYLMPNGVWE